MPSDLPKLSIVIPAFNEEAAIGGTIERCLAAREVICREGGVAEVEILVVSDGSTDATARIARGYRGVGVLELLRNQGYGAAIQAGFRRASGDLLAFLDADGTCDPREFARLCRALLTRGADVALGSRLGPGSQMPWLRRVGNVFYALVLGLLCGRRVTDTASGMRVIRRSALTDLYPLPTGMHFTPAMSARATLNDLKLVEIPMPYSERVGQSKLRVIRDGVRFTAAILLGALCYRPERLFLMGFSLCAFVSLFAAAYPLEFYLQNRWLMEWMIYRFVVCFLLGAAGFCLLCATALVYRMSRLGPGRRREEAFWPSLVASIFEGRKALVLCVLLVGGAIALVWPGFFKWVTTGHTTIHWSRVLVSAFALLLAFQTAITSFLLVAVSLWDEHAAEVPASSPAEGVWHAPARELLA
jgi:glycosyltransferase involved in cell wall biosynthesis